jgi:hypothetical protein
MAYDTMNMAISAIVADLDIILSGVQTVIVGGVSEAKAHMRALWIERYLARVRERREYEDEDVS